MIHFDEKRAGSRIKELREEMGLTQKQLADKIGIARNTITQYELGIASMSVRVLTLLIQTLDTTAEYLLGLTDI